MTQHLETGSSGAVSPSYTTDQQAEIMILYEALSLCHQRNVYAY